MASLVEIQVSFCLDATLTNDILLSYHLSMNDKVLLEFTQWMLDILQSQWNSIPLWKLEPHSLVHFILNVT